MPQFHFGFLEWSWIWTFRVQKLLNPSALVTCCLCFSWRYYLQESLASIIALIIKDQSFYDCHIWLIFFFCNDFMNRKGSISVVKIHTEALHLCSGKNMAILSRAAWQNLTFFSACALLIFWWLTMNVTKPDCGGTTGAVGDVSGIIK